SAARFASSETSGSRSLINSRIGAEEITCSDSRVCSFPCWSQQIVVHVQVASSYWHQITRQPISIAPPSTLVFSAHVSHIIPGPRRGYLKQLISVLITFELSFGRRCGKSAFRIALPNDNPLIRCAAQSAEISRQLIPQTFSV